MTHNPAASAPRELENREQSATERDTINDSEDQRSLRDEVEALLAPPTGVRIDDAGSSADRTSRIVPIEPTAKPSSEDEASGSDFERDTEPSVDVQLLREAMRVAIR